MARAKQDPRDRRIAQLEAKVIELQAELAAAGQLERTAELSTLEYGLRLAQDNEVLRNEVAARKKIDE